MKAKRKSAAGSTSRSMHLLAAVSVPEMEAETLRRALARTDAEIVRVLGVLDAMRAKQVCRQHELAKINARIAANAALSGGEAVRSDVLLADIDGLAHEIFAVAQLMPGEGVEDAADRIKAVIIESANNALAGVEQNA